MMILKVKSVDHLATQHTILKEATISGRLTYYDTFDWRLFNKSLVLFAFQDRLILRKLGEERIIHSINVKSVPASYGSFPKGDLKQYLEPVIKMRRLLKLADFILSHHRLSHFKSRRKNSGATFF